MVYTKDGFIQKVITIKKKKLIFIFWRTEIKTGGERMDFYLWEIAKKNCYGGRLIELDLITEKLPQWIIRLFSIRYIGRTIRMLFYCVALPKERELLIYTHFDLSRYLIVYLSIMRYFYSSKIIIYNHLIDYSINGCINNNRGKLFIENSFIRVANIILTNSVYSKKKLLSFGIPERKIRIIYPVLVSWPSNRKVEIKKELDRTILLFIGTEFLRKGLKPLLEALVILDGHDIFLNIVGDMSKESNLRFIKCNSDLMKRLETKNMVKFLGAVTELHRKEELFRSADVFVMPSLAEGFGIVFAEAMSYSLPIIAADTTCTPELVGEGYNGILVSPEDPKALAKAIKTLADDKALRIKMGDNGYKKIKDFYNSYSIENEFRSVLEELSI